MAATAGNDIPIGFRGNITAVEVFGSAAAKTFRVRIAGMAGKTGDTGTAACVILTVAALAFLEGENVGQNEVAVEILIFGLQPAGRMGELIMAGVAGNSGGTALVIRAVTFLAIGII
jgi:hypothetical protein